MTLKPKIWYPIAAVLSVINLVAVGFAAAEANPDPWHAGIHAALALAFGLWAQRLRQRRGASELQAPLEVLEALDAVEAEVSKLRQEVSETQERLDFTERLLAQSSESRRMGP
ncbi:MAG TPA: hypothetical protein VFS51_01460 [Gemmatimonadales bacterium]|nr:hypothetical protein [Gemmatimonadales bacterium]